jgi:Tol biopolymer transport system component
MNADGTGITRLTTDTSNNRFPVWSPDGSKIAFESDRTGLYQVWVMDADGTNPRQVTTDSATKGQLPDWSPDGSRIAYSSLATGNGDIYVINADGTNPTRLTSDPALDFGPAWSPDGTQIAFTSGRGSATGAQTVYVMNADGSNQHPVHPFGNQTVPAWQPLR